MKKILRSILISCSVLFLLLFGIAAFFLLVQMIQAPKLSEVDASPEGYLSTILDKDGEIINTLYVTESNRIYVELENIPQDLQDAFVAIEDSRFYSHNGIDLKGIARAVKNGITTGSFNQGASTITQQLLKNNVFTDWMSEESFYDSLCRKVQEQYLAIRLEQKYSKEWILENYLNTINLGGGTRGVQVAAQYYFGKDVSELSLAESALIAGITKNPTAYNPLLNPEKSLNRQELVLDAMLKQGYISQEEYDQALAEDVIGELITDSEERSVQVFSWFEDALLLQIVEDLITAYRYEEAEAWDLIYSGGLTIYSTVDPKLQDICEEEATNPNWYTDNEEISIVMTDVSSGAVRAIVGSSREKTESLVYNRATDAVRQPGSTIKVIGEYAAALDTGELTLGTVISDEPYTYSDGTTIGNGYTTYKGMITVREAIACSSNVTALKAFQMIGEDTVYKYLQKFGITTLTKADRNEALAIGGTYNGVTNLELTAAYNAIANEGRYVEPYFYTKVVDRNGNVILENPADHEQVISRESAQLLTSAMESVIKNGTGTSAAVSGINLAGKSGTTNGNKDIWFVGFSSEYTCGIWGGYDENLAQSYSGYVKSIWKSVMEEAHQNIETTSLVETAELKTASICSKCGNLAIEGVCDDTVQGNMVYVEYFEAGTEPAKECDCHVVVTVCQDSGMQANSYCNNTEDAVYLKSATAGTADEGYVCPEGLEETCSQHKSFWDKLWGNESDEEADEKSDGNWFENFFQGLF